MSDFVNYSKREVSLPWGWKDLIQVLGATKHSASSTPGVEEPQNEASCHIVKPLSEIQRYVGLVVDSKTELSLDIVPFTGAKLPFTVEKLSANHLQGSVTVRMHTDAETQVRRFLESRGFAVPDRSVPPMFNRDLPVEMLCQVSLPHDEMKIAKLVSDFFCEVWGLNHDSELMFRYFKLGSD